MASNWETVPAGNVAKSVPPKAAANTSKGNTGGEIMKDNTTSIPAPAQPNKE
jgi:hypothetical protein